MWKWLIRDGIKVSILDGGKRHTRETVNEQKGRDRTGEAEWDGVP